MENRTWLNKKEVAVLIGKSTRTVERLMNERRIPYYRTSGYPQFDKNQINSWIEKKAIKTT